MTVIRRTYLGYVYGPQFGAATYILDKEASMQAQEALTKIDRFIRAERDMRERVFRKKPGTQRVKVKEADEALDAVQALRDMLHAHGAEQAGSLKER